MITVGKMLDNSQGKQLVLSLNYSSSHALRRGEFENLDSQSVCSVINLSVCSVSQSICLLVL